MDERAVFEAKRMKTMVGAKIVDAIVVDDFPAFVIETTDGVKFIVAISQDEEGNGPGSLIVEPMPKKMKRA